MHRILYILMILIACSGCEPSNKLVNRAKVTIKVVDESDRPIEGSMVVLTGQKPEFTTESGTSDASGKFTANLLTINEVTYGANMNGYYKSEGLFIFKNIKSRQWQPWNAEIKVMLKRIINPVPMFAHDTTISENKIEIPVPNKQIGFDLIEYDWVKPYGNGKHADLIFLLEQRFINLTNFDSTVTLTFPGKYDGIIKIKDDLQSGSLFKMPRYAAETGYQSKLVLTKSADPEKGFTESYEENTGYIIRIRSEGRKGEIVSAMYGKIQGDIRLGIKHSASAALFFKYYLNPDYSRNLEYDPKRNLFTNLSILEQVSLEK